MAEDFDVVMEATQQDKKPLVEYLDQPRQEQILNAFNNLRYACHAISRDKGFWNKDEEIANNLRSGQLQSHYELFLVSTKLMLMVSELSEALEGMRTGNTASDKLAEFGLTQMEEELADTVIRIMDLAGKFQWDIGRAIVKKLQYNTGREKLHGKKF